MTHLQRQVKLMKKENIRHWFITAAHCGTLLAICVIFAILIDKGVM